MEIALAIELADTAQSTPDKIAFVAGDTTITYAALSQRVSALSYGLSQRGIGPGDRIALHLLNGLDLVSCYLACFRIGAVAVPIHNALQTVLIDYVLHQSAPKMLIIDGSFVDRLDGVTFSPESCFVVGEDAQYPSLDTLFCDAAEFDSVHIPTDADALILYSSGSTSRPKGAVHTRRALDFILNTNDDAFQVTSESVLLVSLSLSHDASLCAQLLPGLKSGATLILLPDDGFQPDMAIRQMRDHNVTHLLMLPGQCRQLAEAAVANKVTDLAVQHCWAGGDVIDESLQQHFHQAFGIGISQCFGMTEIFIATIQDAEDNTRRASLGRCLPGFDAQILGPEGPLPNGEEGLLCFRSPCVATQYLDQPEMSAKTFVDGWCHTGDLAVRDEDGFIWFRGRVANTIMQDATNVSPQDIEAVFYKHNTVKEVCVVGVPDPILGEAIHAHVVVKPAAQVDADVLMAFVKQFLANDCWPQALHFHNELPLTGLGKVDRKRLIAQSTETRT